MAIPNYTDNKLEASGVLDSANFGLSVDDEAHIMHLLRSAIYSDRILAVLREYATNAWDAHIEAGKADVPIYVKLPEANDYTLVIRDYGNGLSHDDVLRVYTQYGRSTKRSEAKSCGMLGIGSKSAFAYTDSFTVTSCHGGKRRVYVASLDESNKGVMQLLDESDCGDETGVEIKLGIKPSDVQAFRDRALQLFKHFVPRPDINIELPQLPANALQLKSGTIERIARAGHGEPSGRWVAVMGCVPYAIRLDQLPLAPEHKRLYRMNGTLRFAVNALAITASREELDYREATKRALVERFTALVDEHLHHVLKEIEEGNISPFERRLKVRQLISLEFVLPDKRYKALGASEVTLFANPAEDPLYLVYNRKVTNEVAISESLTLYIDDTARDLKGYDLDFGAYIVRRARKRRSPLSANEVAAVRKDLDRYLEACGLTGVPVRQLSELPWDPSKVRRSRGGTATVKDPMAVLRRKTRVFVYDVEDKPDRRKLSENWALVEDHAPSDDDVFVVIDNYRVVGYRDIERWHARYAADKAVAELLGLSFPKVIAYKTTSSQMVQPSDIEVGIHYDKWRKERLIEPHMAQLTQLHAQWTWIDSFHCAPSDKHVACVAARLGKTHPITLTLTWLHRVRKKFDGLGNVWRRLGSELQLSDQQEPYLVKKALYERYILLRSVDGWPGPWSIFYDEWAPAGMTCGDARDIRAAWIEYVKLVDAKHGGHANIFDRVPYASGFTAFVAEASKSSKPALALVP